MSHLSLDLNVNDSKCRVLLKLSIYTRFAGISLDFCCLSQVYLISRQSTILHPCVQCHYIIFSLFSIFSNMFFTLESPFIFGYFAIIPLYMNLSLNWISFFHILLYLFGFPWFNRCYNNTTYSTKQFNFWNGIFFGLISSYL